MGSYGAFFWREWFIGCILRFIGGILLDIRVHKEAI